MKSAPETDGGGKLPRLKLLGGFELVDRRGRDVHLKTRKARVLLAFLALAGGEQPRSRLKDLLWSTRSEQQAAGSLRQALTELRRELEAVAPAALSVDRNVVALDVGGWEVDALRLLEAAGTKDPATLREVPSLYAGDLLDGIDVRDPQCEQWVRRERERFRLTVIEAMERLLTVDGDTSAGETASRRLIDIDPLNEHAHRFLIRRHIDSGNRAQAIKQYEALESGLRAEFDVEPAKETRTLLESVLGGRREDDHGAAASGAGSEAAAQAAADRPDFTVPDIPSVAVLPFANLSGDPAQDYLGDGITEEIITALSRIPDFLVIARQSMLVYRNADTDVRRVGREQGVRYVLEGSVRISGKRIRVTAQLIDASTGLHRWAERYDRELEDVFAVQDDIAKNVATALQVTLTAGEQARIFSSGTNNFEAWECTLRGKQEMERHQRDSNIEARQLLRRALDLDPDYVTARVYLGWTLWEDDRWEWRDAGGNRYDQAFEAAHQALELDKGNPDALALLGMLHISRGDTDPAVEAADQAVAAAPGHAFIAGISACVYRAAGDLKKSRQMIERAIRLNPVFPAWYQMVLGSLHYLEGDGDRGVAILREAVRREPGSNLQKTWFVAALAGSGRLDEARSFGTEIMRTDPDFTVARWVESIGMKDPEISARMSANLSAAGLPGA